MPCYGDEKLVQNILSCHQAAHNLLLLQVNEVTFNSDDVRVDLQKSQYWMLMDTDGCPRAMPADLNSILNASEDLKFHADSYSTKNGNMGLVLTLFKDKMLKKIQQLQLN